MIDLDTHLPAIAAGDAAAFGRWLAGAERPLRASLRRFAAVVDTEAVLQEGLLRVWQVAPKVTADGKANALLRVAHRIVRNAAIDAARRERIQPLDPVLLEAASEPLEPVPPDPALRRAIAECRDKLPPAPGRALTARLGGLGARHDRDLAEHCEMSLNTFLKNIGRAKKLLLDCLERRGIAVEVG